MRSPACSLLFLLAPLALPAPQEVGAASDVDREDYLADLDGWLATHRILRTIERVRLEDWPPAVIDVQPAAEADAGYERALGSELGPWMQKLEEIFGREYAGRLSLSRATSRPLLALLVLASRGDYVNYLDAGVPGGASSSTAAFDPRQGIVVTYRDARTPLRSYREDILRACARALVESHRLEQTSRWSALWLEEGFLRYLTAGGELLPEDMEKHPLDPEAIAYVERYSRDPHLRAGYLHTLPELVGFANASALENALAKKTAESGLEHDHELASYLFEAEAYLFVHFLHHGLQGRRREAFDQVLERVLAGEPSARAATEVFGEKGLATLEPAFWSYVHLLASTVQSDGSVLVPERTTLVDAPILVPVLPPAGEDEAAGTEPEWSGADFVLRASEAPAWIARAVHRAHQGDCERALADLQALATHELDPDLSRRLELEQQRIATLRALREDVLAELAAAHKLVKLELDGEKLSFRIAAVEEERVLLDENRAGLEAIEKTRIPPEQLLANASKEALARAGSWIAAWPASVSGDAKWKRMLVNDDSEGGRSLRADAETYYPGIARAAEAALCLEQIAALAEVRDVTEAAAVHEAIRSLWARHRNESSVRSRAEALRGVATRAIHLLAEGYQVLDHLHAKTVERLPGDAMRLTYVFEDPAELEDFVADPAMLQELAYGLPALVLPDSDTSVGLREGALVGNGKQLLRHVLDFEPPMRLRWTASFSMVEGKPNKQLHHDVGLCADKRGGNIHADFCGWMYLETRVEEITVPAAGTRDVYPEKPYALELRHDGQHAECWRDGVLLGSSPADEWPGGSVFLLFHSDMRVSVLDLVIEGRPMADSFETARQAWIENQIEALGIEKEGVR